MAEVPRCWEGHVPKGMKNRLWEWLGLARDTEGGWEEGGSTGRAGSGASREDSGLVHQPRPGMEIGGPDCQPQKFWAFAGHLVLWAKPGGRGLEGWADGLKQGSVHS